MTLRTKIEQDLIAAQKNRDSAVVETLRFLVSAIKYKEIDQKAALGDEEVLEVIAKQVKTHKESIEAFLKGGRGDLVATEEAQLRILESFLPARLSEDGIRERVSKKLGGLKNEGQTVDFGILMKSVMIELKGQAEGLMVRKVVEEVLKEG